MKVNNPLYKNQGVHVIASIFTVEKGVTKVLLIRRKNEPFKDMWALVGGALYNNEELIDGIKREIKEKTGIEEVELYFSSISDKIDRSPLMRMIAISYIGIIDKDRVNILKETMKTKDSDWVPLDSVPSLAYDHGEIIKKDIENLKEKIVSTNILMSLFPNGFTMPELISIYESILNIKLDRRNFRKKLITNNIIYDTNKTENFEGKKPAKIYKFKEKIKNHNIF